MTQAHTSVRGTDNHDDSDSEVHCPSQRDTGRARLLAAAHGGDGSLGTISFT